MFAATDPSGDADRIPDSLAARPAKRFTAERRAEDPEARRYHPRAIELAEAMREVAGCGEGPTEKDMAVAGFSFGEIIEHLPQAKLYLAETFVKQVAPQCDRVPEIIQKALDSVAHQMPRTGGLTDDEAEVAGVEWRRFCVARAAFKLDPWFSQSERTLNFLRRFLAKLPLLEREANRVIAALGAAHKADLMRAPK
ncbi:hypothetical protein [Mesorhizobium sp.]|uniref:hypothetical protein n=1 Tax=Mesorhizobium sp. TaxID=1871066 RepID=UPI000FE45EB1|nr:hypothetical protein [Mesorhizobium sp.]RWN11786.1 MAG: hypothetical protein EOR87_14820 [Mesorhizobium sp.]RWN19427.1 MAG: hypothetical protein EOR88_09745 [Mesorhizobium sp.]